MKTKYTFEDWLNVKVVLKTTKGIFDEVSDENKVSFEDFDEIEVFKIKEKQKSIFNELLDKKYNDLKSEFLLKLENSKLPQSLIQREYNSIQSLFKNKFSCINNIYVSPIIGDNKSYDAWYYLSMINHFQNCKVAGIVNDFSEIPSPNSRFYLDNLVPPEVMLSAYLKMFNLMARMISPKKPVVSKQKDDINIEQEVENKVEKPIVRQLNPEEARFFVGVEAYDFFIKCKNGIKNRGKIRKNNIGEFQSPLELNKYSCIFHFMMSKKLIFEKTNHSSFLKYLIEKHDANIPKNQSKFPHRYSDSDREKIELWYEVDFGK